MRWRGGSQPWTKRSGRYGHASAVCCEGQFRGLSKGEVSSAMDSGRGDRNTNRTFWETPCNRSCAWITSFSGVAIEAREGAHLGKFGLSQSASPADFFSMLPSSTPRNEVALF